VLEAPADPLGNGANANLNGVGYKRLDIQLAEVILHNTECLRERPEDMEVMERVEQRPLAIKHGHAISLAEPHVFDCEVPLPRNLDVLVLQPVDRLGRAMRSPTVAASTSRASWIGERRADLTSTSTGLLWPVSRDYRWNLLSETPVLER
jgi:hypothetical protein